MSEEHSKIVARSQVFSPIVERSEQSTRMSIPLHWLMLGIALLAQVTVSIVTQGVPTLAPFLQADLGLTRGQVGLFNSAVTAGSLVSMFAAGWVVDVKGERAALIWGNLLVGVFCFAVTLTQGFLAALVVNRRVRLRITDLKRRKRFEQQCNNPSQQQTEHPFDKGQISLEKSQLNL